MMKNATARTQLHPGFVASGFLTLLGSAYLDSIRGPLLPVIAQELALPYADVGWFLTIGNMAAVAFVLALLFGVNRVSEKSIAIGMCIFAALSTSFAVVVDGMWSLLAFGIMLGGSIALLSTMCNVLTMRGTPDQWRSQALAGQHVMYGLGCLLAPFTVSTALKSGLPWSLLIAGSSLFFAVLAWQMGRRLPRAARHSHAEHRQPLHVTPLQGLVILIFALYVAGEVVTSMWMSTFLKEARNIPLVDTTWSLMLFFALMAITRFLCFLFIRPRYEKPVIMACIVLAFVCFMISYAYLPGWVGLCGVLGPFYPVFLARISRVFPGSWRSLSIWVNVAIQSALAVFHLSVGSLTDRVGIGQAYLMAPCLMILTFIALTVYFRLEGAHLTTLSAATAQS